MAPTWELNIETYGYGKRRKVYDPDYEHVESAKFREYERLEGDGYDKSLLDPDKDKIKKLHAPGLGHDPRAPKTLKNYNEAESNKYTTSDYVVPPKVPQLQLGPGIGPKRCVFNYHFKIHIHFKITFLKIISFSKFTFYSKFTKHFNVCILLQNNILFQNSHDKSRLFFQNSHFTSIFAFYIKIHILRQNFHFDSKFTFRKVIFFFEIRILLQNSHFF